MIENKVYEFKKEFCKELNIPMNQAERRLNELLEWLKNYIYEKVNFFTFSIYIITYFFEKIKQKYAAGTDRRAVQFRILS